MGLRIPDDSPRARSDTPTQQEYSSSLGLTIRHREPITQRIQKPDVSTAVFLRIDDWAVAAHNEGDEVLNSLGFLDEVALAAVHEEDPDVSVAAKGRRPALEEGVCRSSEEGSLVFPRDLRRTGSGGERNLRHHKTDVPDKGQCEGDAIVIPSVVVIFTLEFAAKLDHEREGCSREVCLCVDLGPEPGHDGSRSIEGGDAGCRTTSQLEGRCEVLRRSCREDPQHRGSFGERSEAALDSTPVRRPPLEVKVIHNRLRRRRGVFFRIFDLFILGQVVVDGEAKIRINGGDGVVVEVVGLKGIEKKGDGPMSSGPKAVAGFIFAEGLDAQNDEGGSRNFNEKRRRRGGHFAKNGKRDPGEPMGRRSGIR